jgi:hypothetical protein
VIELSNKLRCIVVIPELPLQYGLCSITVNVYCLATLVNSSNLFYLCQISLKKFCNLLLNTSFEYLEKDSSKSVIYRFAPFCTF